MRKRTTKVRCQHFIWTVSPRRGIWQADGRSGNPVKLCRYSLNSSNYDTALEELKKLDFLCAMEKGLASRDVIHNNTSSAISLSEGWILYKNHLQRPGVMGGTTSTTLKRYQAVFNKFAAFAAENGITTWNEVDVSRITGYASWLERNDYAYNTVFLELMTLKQVINWMIKQNLLPITSKIVLSLKKNDTTSTYCYSAAEITAMVGYCRSQPELGWLADIIIILSETGLRIGELVAARWENITDDFNWWEVVDNSRSGTLTSRKNSNTTKTHRSRRIPISNHVRGVLRQLSLKRRSDGRVMSGPNGGMLKADQIRIALRRDVLASLSGQFPKATGGKGFIDGRLHSFRHYFCSNCADHRIPERTLMDWLGHADSRMIRRYYHLRDEESLKRMRELDHIGQNDIASRQYQATLASESGAS
jgi:integrase